MTYSSPVVIARPYCKVVTPRGVHEGVSLHMPRDASAVTIRKRTDVLEERGPVDDVQANNMGEQVFVFADGERWVVSEQRQPCLPCGQR